ncbi:hypothetical protein BKA70DRAFT_1521248 [Coprinopsis sp. MPI-PUGE-AT-0042]|nr:hypothetical protein BKA70DRAFT_1521248 [Coprinopsis sp. MPI-PUGE-AT-0042]
MNLRPVLPAHIPSSSPPLPLTFDRVNGSTPITSTAPFFRYLPVEILHKLLLFLGRHELAALALVDRDSRQLARSSQFATITLDYDNDHALQLLSLLEVEAGLSPASSPSSASVLPTRHDCGFFGIPLRCSDRRIGSCVRKIRVIQCPFSVTGLREVPLFFHRVARVLVELPHLSSVEWISPETVVSSEVMEALGSISRLQALKLIVAASEGDGFIRGDEGDCHLESFTGSLDSDPSTSTFDTTRSIIRAASGTIRNLTLLSSKLSAVQSLPIEVYSMEKISTLCLNDVAFPLYQESALLNIATFGSKITNLTLSTFDLIHPSAADSNQSHPTLIHLPCLRHFTWTSSVETTSTVPSAFLQAGLIQFLERHVDLESLSFVRGLPPSFVDIVIALLVQSHEYLSSLRIVWQGDVIPEDGLKGITSLVKTRNLKHLWISAGSQGDDGVDNWRIDYPNWLADHDAIFHALLPAIYDPSPSPTPSSLQTLIITRDTYPSSSHPLLASNTRGDRYYLDRVLPTYVSPDFFLTNEERKWRDEPRRCEDPNKVDFDTMQSRARVLMSLAWERWHASRMQGNAMMYLKGIAPLERCFVGGLWLILGDERMCSLCVETKRHGRRALSKFGTRLVEHRCLARHS